MRITKADRDSNWSGIHCATISTSSAKMILLVVALHVIILASYHCEGATIITLAREEEQQHRQQQATVIDEYGPKTIASKIDESGNDGQLSTFDNDNDVEVVTYQQVLERFPDAFRADLTTLRQMATTTNSEIAKPIMNMGMNKGGSTTLDDFLICSGYKTCHYLIQPSGDVRDKRGRSNFNQVVAGSESGTTTVRKRPALNEIIGTCMDRAHSNHQNMLVGCGYPDRCEAFTQMDNWYGGCIYPQHEYLEDLLDEAANDDDSSSSGSTNIATLVLPIRNFVEWMESSHRWNTNLISHRDQFCPYYGFENFFKIPGGQRQQKQRDAFLEELGHNQNDQETTSVLKQLFRLRGVDEWARTALFIAYHVTYVRSVAKRTPNVTLIEYNLDDEETGTLLSNALQLPSTNECWGHTNVNTVVNGGASGNAVGENKTTATSSLSIEQQQ